MSYLELKPQPLNAYWQKQDRLFDDYHLENEEQEFEEQIRNLMATDANNHLNIKQNEVEIDEDDEDEEELDEITDMYDNDLVSLYILGNILTYLLEAFIFKFFYFYKLQMEIEDQNQIILNQLKESKLKEKRLILNIDRKKNENENLQKQIEMNLQQNCNKNEDLLQDISLNNEFNTYMRLAIEKEKIVDELNMKIFLKNIDKIENLANIKDSDISEKMQSITERNQEFKPLILPEYTTPKLNEIKQLNKLIEELKKEIQQNNLQISEFQKEEKVQIDQYSSYLRVLKEQKNKNQLIQQEIQELKKRK